MNIRHGFLIKEYVEYGGLACIVMQPNGNYIIITHGAYDFNNKQVKEKWGFKKAEYIGDFIEGLSYHTKDIDTDPNIQIEKKMYIKKYDY
jgi:hypothetical protein